MNEEKLVERGWEVYGSLLIWKLSTISSLMFIFSSPSGHPPDSTPTSVAIASRGVVVLARKNRRSETYSNQYDVGFIEKREILQSSFRNLEDSYK